MTPALSRSLRFAIGGFVAALAGIVALEGLGAQGFAGHDSNAPVNYSADRIELQDKASRVVLSGNVEIRQGDMTLTAPRTTVSYTNEGSLKIQRLDAVGGVFVKRGSESARGDVAVYDFNKRIITVVGNVLLDRGGGDVQHSGRMVIDLASRNVVTDSGPGGRVSGTFSVNGKQ
ncbi:MAG: OstA family protein [Sphingomonadales bacterium]|nr:OstA family protein [Sphingomonadales bacterium]